MRKITSLLLVLLITACGNKEQAKPQGYELLSSQNGHYFVYVEPAISSNKSTLTVIANYVCKVESICIVMFWSNQSQAAKELPMSDAQVNAQVAHFNLNNNTGLYRLMLCNNGNCNP